MKKTLLFTVYTVIAVICFCSCTKTVVTNSMDELAAYEWYFEDSTNLSAALSFKDMKATLNIYEEKKLISKFCGYYKIDTDSFIIFDEDTMTEIKFDYVLHGSTLDLSYKNEKLTFKRRESKE